MIPPHGPKNGLSVSEQFGLRDGAVTLRAHHPHMALPPAERIGVAVVRVWIEPDGELRGRITTTLDVTTSDEAVSAAAGSQDVTRAVAEFLEAFVAVTRR